MAAARTLVPATGAVRLLVGFGLGSNTDWVARIMAEALREQLGRPVVVENLPGRAAAAAAEAVGRSAPDGATLGLFPASFATVRHASHGVAFDPLTDFTPLSLIATAPSVILVTPGYPARNLGGLAVALRAAPDTPCATPGEGSFLHLSTVLLVRALGATCRAVHYAEPAQALADLAAGRVQIYVNNAPHLAHGRARGPCHGPRCHLPRAARSGARAPHGRRNRVGLRSGGLVRAARPTRPVRGHRGTAGAGGGAGCARSSRGKALAGARRRANRLFHGRTGGPCCAPKMQGGQGPRALLAWLRSDGPSVRPSVPVHRGGVLAIDGRSTRDVSAWQRPASRGVGREKAGYCDCDRDAGSPAIIPAVR